MRIWESRRRWCRSRMEDSRSGCQRLSPSPSPRASVSPGPSPSVSHCPKQVHVPVPEPVVQLVCLYHREGSWLKRQLGWLANERCPRWVHGHPSRQVGKVGAYDAMTGATRQLSGAARLLVCTE